MGHSSAEGMPAFYAQGPRFDPQYWMNQAWLYVCETQ